MEPRDRQREATRTGTAKDDGPEAEDRAEAKRCEDRSREDEAAALSLTVRQ